MLKETRIDLVLKMITEQGSVDISNTARVLNVTPITIRRDLDDLANRGIIERIHGGARLASPAGMTEMPFDQRATQNELQKFAIAKNALKLINENAKVIIDSGTTTFTLAKMIDNSQRIVVITNSINIAMELLIIPKVKVISVGGEVRKNTISCADNLAERFLDMLSADIAFVGISAFGLDGSMYNISIIESGIKKAIFNCAEKTYILADSSKINKKALTKCGNVKDFNAVLITDSNISAQDLNELQNNKIEVIVADIN